MAKQVFPSRIYIKVNVDRWGTAFWQVIKEEHLSDLADDTVAVYDLNWVAKVTVKKDVTLIPQEAA